MYPITYPPKHPPKYPLLHKATPRPEPEPEIDGEVIKPLLVDSIFDFKKVDYTTFEPSDTVNANLTDFTISFALPAG